MVGSREDSSGKRPGGNEALLSFRHHLADRWAPQNVPIPVVGGACHLVSCCGADAEGRRRAALLTEAIMMKLTVLAVTLPIVLLVAGCASCESCKNIPGWDGRYATHDRGALNREGRTGLPAIPYVQP